MKPQTRSLDPFATYRKDVGSKETVAPWINAQSGSRPATLPASAVRSNAYPAPRQSDLSVLEAKYPGMAQAITLLWGHPEMNAYFERIWMADSVQTPLHPEAMAELMMLARLHQDLKPQRPASLNQTMYGSQYKIPPRTDVWEGTRPTRTSRGG